MVVSHCEDTPCIVVIAHTNHNATSHNVTECNDWKPDRLGNHLHGASLIWQQHTAEFIALL